VTDSELFAHARQAFQENLDRTDMYRDPQSYNLSAGLIALASGLEVLSKRLDRIEAQVSGRS
jgi:hypothetical protein